MQCHDTARKGESMSTTVPTNTEFLALKSTVAALGTQVNAATAANVVDAQRLATLEAAVLALQGITAPPPVVVPEIPPVTAAWPHEPVGFTILEDRGWEAGLGAWFRKFTSSDKPIRVVPITDSKLGEASALEILYPQGHQGGGGTELESAPFPAVKELYVGFWAQVSSNWQGHSSGINKLVYLADDAVGFHAMWYELFGSGSQPLGFYVVNQSGPDIGYHDSLPGAISRGVWHQVEIYQKQGAGNGIIQVWVDGLLAIQQFAVVTRDTPFTSVTISGIWGGIGDTKAHDDYMRFDRIRISGR